MASQSQKDTLPIAVVFSNLFRNLPRLMLTNLLFAVPLGAFFALFWFLTTVLPLSDMQASMLMLLTIILVFPFYAGVVKVTAKMTDGEEKVPVFSNYFSAVKDNFLRFLVHGVVLFYRRCGFSVVSVNLYVKLDSVKFHIYRSADYFDHHNDHLSFYFLLYPRDDCHL